MASFFGENVHDFNALKVVAVAGKGPRDVYQRVSDEGKLKCWLQ